MSYSDSVETFLTRNSKKESHLWLQVLGMFEPFEPLLRLNKFHQVLNKFQQVKVLNAL